ncbi:MAG TPA: PRC-barrel domain-containing protein [Longimicrobiaceae bacterium]|nr:PRC-barrel domain-containing protein [Longimicrobiaceae bacterium]
MADATSPRAEILRTRDFLGWDVADAAGSRVGTVADLLIDRQGRVRFLAVDTGLFRKPVLLPVSALEWGEGALVLGGWTNAQLKLLPPYDPDVPLTRDVLDELERGFPRFYGESGALLPPAEPEGEARIVPMRDARDFKLSKGAPDPRGWTVFGADNERVGTVTDLLVDAAALKVRYLDVDLADDLFRLVDDRHVLLPLEAVELRERGEDVWVAGLTAADLGRLPAYLGGAVDPVIEQRVGEAFRLASTERVAPVPAHDVLPPDEGPPPLPEPPLPPTEPPPPLLEAPPPLPGDLPPDPERGPPPPPER